MNRTMRLALNALLFVCSIFTLLLVQPRSLALGLIPDEKKDFLTAIKWSGNFTNNENGKVRVTGKVSIAKDDKYKSIKATAVDADGKVYKSSEVGFDGNVAPEPNSEVTFYADFKDLPAGKYTFKAELTYELGKEEKKLDASDLTNITVK